MNDSITEAPIKNDEIIRKVIEVVSAISQNANPITPTTNIIEEKYIDSLSVFNIILNLEKVFKIKINPMSATIEDFSSPISISKLIVNLTNSTD